MNHSDIKRQQDESIKHYKIRLCENKDYFELSWNDVAELINTETGDKHSSDVFRKFWRYFKEGYDYAVETKSEDEYLQDIKDQTLELKKERIKLQSEKVEYNKLVREDSRSELIEEKIIQAINERPTIKVPQIHIKLEQGKKDYLFPIADIHYSAEFVIRGWFDEILNEYNPQIAQRRLWDLLEQFVQYNDAEKINHVHLPNLGDSLDGILRMSQLQWIKMGNVDSAIEFAEFLSQWLNELSKYTLIDYYAVQGNHTELRLLNGKRNDFPHENMEKVVSHIIDCNLKNNKNVNVHKCKNHMYFDVVGTKVLAVHGHQEKNLEKSINTYPRLYGHPVDLMISGHLHHGHEKTVGMNGLKDIKFVQVQSIVGIDHFSMDIKESANAGARLMIIEENHGLKTSHDLRVK